MSFGRGGRRAERTTGSRDSVTARPGSLERASRFALYRSQHDLCSDVSTASVRIRHIRKAGVRWRAPKASRHLDVAFDAGAGNRTIGSGACGRNRGCTLGAMQAQITDEVDLVTRVQLLPISILAPRGRVAARQANMVNRLSRHGL